MKLRRANILSDLLAFDDVGEEIESELFNEADFRVDMEEVAERIDADTVASRVQTTFKWSIPHSNAPRRQVTPDSTLLHPTLTSIEDFAAAENGGISAFCDTLLLANRPVRIAFMGDSFVEGDILTADLRERLQTAYGGGGAGFAPMASPLTGFRRTIKTQSKGWTSHNIMQRKSVPMTLRDNFYVSGWVCQPTTGATTRWENSNYRQRLDSVTTARIFFVSQSNSRIEVMLNDTLRRVFTISGDPTVRQIVVNAPHLHSLGIEVLSGADKFIGYGAVFESKGVVVDNYSIRSNNGQAMFWTNPSVNAQINALLGYDLVILQYGLNIMHPNVYNYTTYANQIEKMVAFVRQCFPGAAVLVLGVSDRSTKTDAGFTSIATIPSMLIYQRRAAENTGSGFWSTYGAMRSMGGMEQFVANGWAGKDYTHINYSGGRRIAWSLFDAINAEVRKAYAARQLIELRKQKGVLDTQQQQTIEQRLLPGIALTPTNTPPK